LRYRLIENLAPGPSFWRQYRFAPEGRCERKSSLHFFIHAIPLFSPPGQSHECISLTSLVQISVALEAQRSLAPRFSVGKKASMSLSAPSGRRKRRNCYKDIIHAIAPQAEISFPQFAYNFQPLAHNLNISGKTRMRSSADPHPPTRQ
jgi:hypothetical protein